MRWRAAIVLALLLPLAVPPAQGTLWVYISTDRGGAYPDYRWGETVTIYVNVWTTDETTTVHGQVKLTKILNGTAELWLNGGTAPISPGTGAGFRVYFPPPQYSQALAAGRWRAEYSVGDKTVTRDFDYDYGPNFVVHNMSVVHARLVQGGPSNVWLRDGITKDVYACVSDVGNRDFVNDAAPQSMKVSLHYRTHVDPLLFGGLTSPRVPTPDWRNGHTVDTKTVNVYVTSSQPKCPWTGPGPQPFLVKFHWEVESTPATELPFLTYRLGIRADPTNEVWETREDAGNWKELDSTVQPLGGNTLVVP